MKEQVSVDSVDKEVIASLIQIKLRLMAAIKIIEVDFKKEKDIEFEEMLSGSLLMLKAILGED